MSLNQVSDSENESEEPLSLYISEIQQRDAESESTSRSDLDVIDSRNLFMDRLSYFRLVERNAGGRYAYTGVQNAYDGGSGFRFGQQYLTLDRFEKLESVNNVRDLGDSDKCCSICYDDLDLVHNPLKRDKDAANLEEQSESETADGPIGAKDSDTDKAQKANEDNNTEQGNKRTKLNNETSSPQVTTSNVRSEPQIFLSDTVLKEDAEESKFPYKKVLDLKHNGTKLPCGHIFGTSCIYKWLKTSVNCPYCRQEVQGCASRYCCSFSRVQISDGIIVFRRRFI